MKGFSITEVIRITEVSAQKLRRWEEKGLIKPSMSPNRLNDKGKLVKTRRYALQDMVCILVVQKLRDRGLSLERIRKSVENVEITGVEQPLAKLRVACLANAVYFKDKGKYFDPISGQIAIEEALEVIRPKLKPRRYAPGKRAVEKTNRHYQKKIMAF